MSLLMEALKKAEQAKQKAAAENVVASPAVPRAPESVPVPPSATKLELTPAEPAPPKIEPVYATEPPLVTPPPQEPKFTTIVERVAPIAEMTMSPKPEPKVERPPVAAPIVSPAPPAPLAQAIPAPAAKQHATVAAPSSKIRPAPRSMLWPVLVVVVFLSLGTGGYWYYNSMSAFLMKQTTQGLPIDSAQVEAVPAVEPVLVAPPVAVKPTLPVAGAKSSVVKAPRKPDAAAPMAATAPLVPAMPEPPLPAAPPISVSRNVDQTEIFNLLQQGYRHYQNGDDLRAQVLYAQVLNHEEHNRDALLGMAAIAVRQRNTLKAQEIYSELLTLDPRDTVAQAGFVSVTRSLDPLQQEARVKQMLEQEPNAPHLLFTYATFLMQQQRWSEASRVLLSAYQTQRDNADYAFNLAVTMDHLGQNENALKFYGMALDLTRTQAASFRPDDVRKRIANLQAPRNE